MSDNDLNEFNKEPLTSNTDSFESGIDGFEFIEAPVVPTEDIDTPPLEFNEDNMVPVHQKKPSKKNYIRIGILAVAIAVFIFSAWQLISIALNYKKGDKQYQDVENQVFATDGSVTTPTVITNPDSSSNVIDKVNDTGYKFLTYNHEALKSINSDAQGYLDMPGIGVTVPIAYCDNNTTYIDHAIDKKYHSYGCPFIDYRINAGIRAMNPIIYGHSMKNGAIFYHLRKYLKSDFYTEKTKYMYLYCEDGVYIYEIFSAYVTDAYDAETYVFSYASEETYATYLKNVQKKSRYKTGVSVTNTDHIITLSTCYDDTSTRRIIVHAKRL